MIKKGAKKIYIANFRNYFKHKQFIVPLYTFNKNVRIIENKFAKILKLFDLYQKCNLTKDRLKYIEFKNILENQKIILDRQFKELNQYDISQIFDLFPNQTLSLTFDENSEILKNFKFKNEYLIENKIYVTPEIKRVISDLNRNLSENSELKKFFPVLGPLGCGKSIFLKLSNLYYANSKNTNVIYFNFDRFKYLSNTNSDMILKIFIFEFIEQVLKAFYFTLFSDKHSDVEIGIIRDIYELYCNNISDTDEESFKKIMERLLKNLIQYTKKNRLRLIIFLDNMKVNPKENDFFLEIFLNNREIVLVSCFEDNFSYKNFLSKCIHSISLKKLYLTYNFQMIEELISNNSVYLKYFNQYTMENWKRIITEYINKRYFIGSKDEIAKDYSLFSLIEYFTKFNPIFLNKFIQVMKQESHELENDYIVLDLVIDSYEYNAKLMVQRLIRNYLTYQIMIGKNYAELLEELNKFIKFKFNISNRGSEKNIKEILCDDLLFYSNNDFVYVNIPFLEETLSEIANKNN